LTLLGEDNKQKKIREYKIIEVLACG
jgi:hypothetical protein